MVERAVEARRGELGGRVERGRASAAAGPSSARSAAMQPGASAASSRRRASASSSVGVLRPSAGTVPSAWRENSRRPSGEWRLSHDAAHHTSAW